MKEDQDIFDLIEKYHLGLLSDEEKKLVEQRMQNDVSFAEAVKISGMVNEVVHGASLDILRERMTKDLAVLYQEEKLRKQWRIGTVVVLGVLIALVSWIYFPRSSSFKKENVPLPKEPKDRKQIDTAGKTTDSVMILKEDKKYNSSSLNKINEKVQTDTQLIIRKQEPLIVGSLESDSVMEVTIEVPKVNESYKVTEPISIDCKLSFQAIARPTCKGENKGTIEIDRRSISGGKTPYVFYISNSEEKSSSWIFSDLEEGNYTVTMEDANGCHTSKEVMIAEKICSSRKSYSINPDYGEIWKVPFSNGEHGNFTLFNRQGLIIFKGLFGGAELSEWNGVKMDGTTADVGLYICILEYSNGKTEKIEVSIIR